MEEAKVLQQKREKKYATMLQAVIDALLLKNYRNGSEGRLACQSETETSGQYLSTGGGAAQQH